MLVSSFLSAIEDRSNFNSFKRLNTHLIECSKDNIKQRAMKLLILVFLTSSVYECFAIWCYQCTAATPGCMEPFNWRGVGYLGNPCPEDEDICVKLIERKGAEEVITRDCLSNFRAFRTDIPADTYEGCRPAAKDVNLANYVKLYPSMKELDIQRNWYDETMWCFCFLDHRCNGAIKTSTSQIIVMLSTVLVVFLSLL